MGLLKGRLGLDSARVPHADRHGVIWLSRGNLYVDDGTVRFLASGNGDLPAGDYGIPIQTVTAVVLSPGTTISHDTFRIAAIYGTSVVASGDDGTRLYTAPPAKPDASEIGRRQARVWADETTRHFIARRMFARRLGELPPNADWDTLRGIEGARAKRTYEHIARTYGVDWKGRNYDRTNPGATDTVNQAINHASTACYAAAGVAVQAVGAIPQLGFIHAQSGDAFVLDVADLYRDTFTLPVAFANAAKPGPEGIERQVRRAAAAEIRAQELVADMIDTIKALLEAE